MARIALNKSSLARLLRQARSYERYLPSLDLKRKQLLGERAKVREERRTIEEQTDEIRESVRRDLPMLANHEIDLDGLVRLREVNARWENILGTRLPKLDSVGVEIAPYSYLARPHWVDVVVARLSRSLELHVQLETVRRRERLLIEAVRKATQRVNLVEKVLIPRTRAQIRRIQIVLSDAERAAVVRSKIAKRKRLGEVLT